MDNILDKSNLSSIIDNIEPFTLYKLYINSKFDNYRGREEFFNYRERKLISAVTNDFKYGKFLFAKRKFQNLSAKRTRIKKDIEWLLNKDCIFLTLTFDNKHINMDNKRRSIVRWLKGLNCSYIGNVDYGEDNGRIHYHVIVQCDHVNYKSYKYGRINGKRIVNKSADSLRKYIVKLTYHATKDSTENQRILKKIIKEKNNG